MSVLSRPHLRHAPTTTQQTSHVPLQRNEPVPAPAGREPSRVAREAREDHDAKRRRTALAAGGMAIVLGAAGVTTYVVLDDDPVSTSGTTTTTVDVPRPAPGPGTAEFQQDLNRAESAERAADAARGTRRQILE